jgi:hypothetical protein
MTTCCICDRTTETTDPKELEDMGWQKIEDNWICPDQVCGEIPK